MIKIPTLVEEETFKELFEMVIRQSKNGMTFVEVGSFVGGSMCYLGQRLKVENKNIDLISVDNWEFDNINIEHMSLVHNINSYYDTFIDNVNKCGIKVKTIISDSIKASELFDDQSIDFLFLDGNHSYPYVENEIKAWLPKMKKDSIISGHDFSDPMINKAVYNVFDKNVINSVTRGGSYYVNLGKGL